jgi:hypothetical protein
MQEMTNANFARLLKGLTIAVGNRKNRILFYRFLAAEIRALHYSYGVGDDESYKRAMTFLEECERLTLRSLVRKSAERHVEVTVDHAKRVFVRALKKLNASPALAGDLEPSVFAILPRKWGALEIDAVREMDIPVRVVAESSEDVTQTPIAVAGVITRQPSAMLRRSRSGSHSDTRLRRLLGGMSIFTMVMTVPQVLAIWVSHQAGVRRTTDRTGIA